MPPDGPERTYSALVDTGAQITSISRKVVETLGMEPVDTVPIVYAGGNRQLHDKFWLLGPRVSDVTRSGCG